MSEIEKLNMIAEWQEQYKQLIEDLDNSKKRIADLEKENAELKSLKDVADLIRLNNSHIVAMAQLNNNNVALRKENAELKEINEGYCRSRDRLISIGFPNFKDCKEYAEKLKELEKELTNAKEIIKEYINLDYIQLSPCDKVIDLRDKAEQFLNDSKQEG